MSQNVMAGRASTVSAQVWNYQPVLLGQNRNLLSPGEPSLRPSVNENHGRRSIGSGKNVVYVDSVHKSTAMLESRRLREITD